MVIESVREKRVYIETYGCTYNFGDTEKIIRILLTQGCSIETRPGDAEVVIVNTCTVIAPTERRMFRVLAGYREKNLYVAGCLGLVQEAKIRAICTPQIITPAEIYRVFNSLRDPPGKSTGIVQIAQGCLGTCTYCITSKARGSLASFSMDSILNQVTEAVKAGIPEIQLTAQDVSAWGRDIGRSLPELLIAVSDIRGNFCVRVGMMNPLTVKPILPELLEAFASEKLFRFIHIPVQSGSDNVLFRMGRGYHADDFIGIVGKFRRQFPEITLMTDIITGFPGESEEDFERSLRLINQIAPNKVNVTRYSRRENTSMASEKDTPDFIKKDRSRILVFAAEREYHRINAAWIGREVSFIVTEKRRSGSVLARTPNYLNIVLPEDIPLRTRGIARIREDKTYYFTGNIIEIAKTAG